MIHEFIRKCNFDKESVIFEIGSHMGFDTEIMYNNTQNAKIYAFEPDPRNIKILKERSINLISEIIEMGVSDKTATNVLFYISSGHDPILHHDPYWDNNDWSASNSLRKPKLHDTMHPWCKIDTSIEINTTTLDDFCSKKDIKTINFIWMDVQGCEDLVFMGGQKILKNTEYIYTEFFDVELYDGQKNLEHLVGLLPGTWNILAKYENDVLLENIDYKNTFILETGKWNTKNMSEHTFDEQLAAGILNAMKHYKIHSCADLGCGPGEYVNYFNKHGINTDGYDGNVFTPELTNNKCKILDLAESVDLPKYDCVISLEVGEHIPEKYESIFIHNLTNHTNKLLILSWAIPDQGGYGHVNCRLNTYIKRLVCSLGFKKDLSTENILRNSAKVDWFKNTIMVFTK